jgi:hypothetical protein
MGSSMNEFDSVWSCVSDLYLYYSSFEGNFNFISRFSTTPESIGIITASLIIGLIVLY